MDFYWQPRVSELPEELLLALHTQDDRLFLEKISNAAIRHTDQFLVHFDVLIPHVCATFPKQDYFASVAAFGRILPFAPHVAEFAESFLRESNAAGILSSSSLDDDNTCREYLLALYRLLRFDQQTFAPFVSFEALQGILRGSVSPVQRLLAVRVLCLYLNAADDAMEKMLQQYVGAQEAQGNWEQKTIDYSFLTLWEEQRTKQLRRALSTARTARTDTTRLQHRRIPLDLLHPSAACIAGVLLPRSGASPGDAKPDIIHTPTTINNLRDFACCLQNPQPVLLTGLAGSGKTLLVRHAARQLGKEKSMVTLHLNEQSDAKLLIGMYTTGSTPGTFTWQPGVLTTAVMEGRWVFIEDIDRAPNDIISTLLPLIERRELVIPSRGQTIHAARSFRIIATMRTSINSAGIETKPSFNLLGARYWQTIHTEMASFLELRDVMLGLFPSFEREHAMQLVKVFEQLQLLKQQSHMESRSKTGMMRAVNPRDLFKWCARVATLVGEKGRYSDNDLDQMFLDAVDCFAGALPEGDAYTVLAACIAQHMDIDPQRMDHLLWNRSIVYKTDTKTVTIGRNVFARHQKKGTASRKGKKAFSTNAHTLRLLDRVGVAVAQREPLLLVGETGTGKTTSIQHLADQLGKKLVPFNLSQQSESGDLLGGFKPVNARSLIIPMKDEFDDLFAASFSAKKNAHFLEMLNKCMAKSQWLRVCKLWNTALGMVRQQRITELENGPQSPAHTDEKPAKRRRVEPMTVRWDTFADSVKSLEHRLSSGQEAFAFSFVEGNIVKAVRNGDWVLLDEINLASPDTLEALADLFDAASPTLMLSEAGSVEIIRAHPQFRVFAAMNPATDVGKKDLPLGIRSRFTELYVESPDRDLQSLQSIVEVYLGSEALLDAGKAIVKDVCDLHRAIQDLNARNLLVDGAGQKPHFSLRTLTRALTYATDVKSLCVLRRALMEGFQMSFMTLLDKESEARCLPLLYQYITSKIPNAAKELGRPMKKPDDGHTYVKDEQYWLRQGPLPVETQADYIITPFIRRNLNNLIRASFTRRFPVLIQGPTSAGKTSMIEHLAKKSGNKFVRINNHEHTDLQEYLGTYVSGSDGKLTFQEGVLVKALREGHWIVLDELNLAPTDVLEALNRLLDDNRELLIPETQETVRPHENFMLFATQNPAGLYGGRKVLSRAFRNRFLELHFDDIPIEELNEILHKRTQIPPSWCKKIVDVYRELSILRQENRLFESKSFATLRDLFRWAMRNADTIDQLAVNGFMLLAERVRKPEERQAVKKCIEKVLSLRGPKVVIDETKLYSDDSQVLQPYLSRAGSKGVVWTNAMRRLYVLVATAIQNNEPVLLVGETGCGKTTVVQMLADAVAKELHIVNAHQNTETGDLIGAQRPLRNRAAIDQQIRDMLAQLPYSELTQSLPDLSTEDALGMFDRVKLSGGEEDAAIAELQQQIQTLRPRLKALFEWSDGSLVHAMKTGQYFLLDEISLADDSVLERLNSVLESQRSLLLAEKGSLDSFVTAKPGFQFFATMNPGGDYGKRELSPALRNRFTEIWVPALSDMDDISMIVRSKLCQNAENYAHILVDFAQWFNKRFNTSAASSISIRDTLAWVEFINRQSNQDAVFSIIHGAAMVYIDTLGANPAALLAINPGTVSYERAQCLEELSRLLAFDATSIYHAPVTAQVADAALSLGDFSIPIVSQSHTDPSFTFSAPTTASNAMRVVRALQLPKPILLEGNPGVGKTTLVTALASSIGMPLTRINLSEQTDLMDLFGSDVPVEGAAAGTFAWRDAPFLRAMKSGQWVLLDEMNLASQSVLEGLNACLDHRGEVYISELDQTFQRHPDFRLFAAQNPHHQGGGRKGLPASFVNRFTVVYADVFTPDDLILICQKSFPQLGEETIKPLVNYIDRLDGATQTRKIGSLGGPWEFNLRDTLRWLTLATSEEGLFRGGEVGDFFDSVISQRFRTHRDRENARELFLASYGGHDSAEQVTRNNMFHNVASDSLQVGFGLLARNTLVARADKDIDSDIQPFLSVLESVIIGIQKRWPVLLVGPTGSGKTKLVEKLASIAGAEMVTFSMNADVDSMDLVGGYEQSEPQREVQHFLSRLRKFLEVNMIQALVVKGNEDTTRSIHSLLALTEQTEISLATSSGNGAIAELAQELHRLAPQTSEGQNLLAEVTALAAKPASVDRAQFEWMDGMLVRALEQGQWLVLDNANLCSPAVLDRLNSLLEPNGALIVNEHTDASGNSKVIRPHENFRIFFTMDPKYGELSRALRNRAVELFLMPQGPVEPESAKITGGIVLGSEAKVHRLRNAALLAQVAVPEQRPYVADIIADHFSTLDLPLLKAFMAQIYNGLYELPSDILIDSMNRISSLKHIPHAESTAEPTLNRLNNASLAKYSQDNLQLSTWSSALLRMQTDLVTMEVALQSVLDKNVPKREQTRLQRSANAGKTMNAKKDFAVGVFPFLQAFQRALRALFDNFKLDDLAEEHNIEDLAPFRRFWWFLFNLTNSRDVDEAVYSSFLEIGHRLVEPQELAISSSNHSGPLNAIKDGYAEEIGKLRKDTELSNASTMTVLWTALRPETPKTWQQLQDLLELQKMADAFDSAAFRFDAPVEHLLQLRSAFNKALNVAFRGADQTPELLDSLKEAMADIAMSQEEEEPLPPYFAEQFEAILQKFAVIPQASVNAGLDTRVATASLLGLQSSRDALSASRPSVFSGVASFVGAYGNSKTPLTLADDLQTGLLSSVLHIDQVPLGRLSLLKTEIDVLGQILSNNAHHVEADQIDALDGSFSTVLRTFASVLAADSGSPCLRTWGDWASRSLESRNPLAGLSKEQRDSMPSPIEVLLTPCVEYAKLNQHRSTATARVAQAAQAWIDFALGALVLYLPTRAFDPALRPMLERDMFLRTRLDLTTNLAALEQFFSLSGQYSHLRIQELATALENLGVEPITEEIARPPKSQLSALQGEFSALLRALSPLVSELDPSQRLEKSNNDVLRQNILMVKRRLREGYEGYVDITAPVIDLLSALEVGFALSSLASNEKNHDDDMVRAVKKSTPLLGGSVKSVETASNAAAEKNVTLRLHALSSIATLRGLSGPDAITHVAWDGVDMALDGFYEQWRAELQSGQHETAQKSSLYVFRGDAEFEDEVAEQEYAELFPDFEEAGQQVNGGTEAKVQRVQGLAPMLTDALHEIFRSESTTEENVLALLNKATNIVCKTKNASAMTADHGALLSAIFLQLKEKSAVLSGASHDRTTYNIYTHPNMVEANNLILLVRRTQVRFREIQAVWPEHATLADVLRTCDELLAFSYTDPVAKLLTKVEKLHAYVHEWQLVASREYTAQPIYDSITSLIVSWRQLELSTWARMLDMEAEKCDEDSKNWFFVAYESIVAVPLSIAEGGDGLKLHVQELLKTLEGFFHATGLGQYAGRLRMLEDFCRYVKQRAVNAPVLESVYSALSNFFIFMKRYSPLVSEALHKGRQQLDKGMKDVIQLASWKDTNIDALRQSAKASHRKLFKVVRKFRSLLGQPAESIIRAGLLDVGLPELHALGSIVKVDAGVDQQALSHCDAAVKGWSDRPARFKNIAATVSVMFSKSALPASSLNSADEMHTFIADTESLAASLRKATPNILNEENKDTVKHLKNRKRKLFSDVLKELRQMGFKSNLSSDVLGKQDSLHAVLAALPSPGSEDHQGIAYLQRLLHLMPKVREASREHSDDLTGAEIGRSVSLLESMLFVSVQQHSLLCNTSANQAGLQKLSTQINNLWNAETLDIEAAAPNSVVNSISALPTLIATTLRVLAAQANLGKLDLVNVTTELQSFASKLAVVKTQWFSLPSYPAGTSSGLHTQTTKEATDLLSEFREFLASTMLSEPQLAPVLRQLRLWLPEENKVCKKAIKASARALTVTDLSAQVCEFVDTILGAVQDLQTPLSALPTSADDPSYLVHESQQVSTALKSLRLAAVTSKLSTLLGSLQSLRNSEDLVTAAALLQSFTPVLAQYTEISTSLSSRLEGLHSVMTAGAYRLAKLFATIAREGFCTPPDKSADKDQQGNEKLEGGTGLGEGEGGEDISKDIGDDEDLDDLAMEKDQREDKDEIEDQEDAVDMEGKDMEGEMGDAEEKEGDEGEEDGSDKDAESEVGSVDDLGPSTVDEKMWDDGGKDEDQKDKEGDGEGTKDEESMAAAEDGKQDGDDEKKDEEEGSEADEEMGAQEKEDGVAQEEIEQTDPHLDQQENLDLPDDIDMDGANDDDGDESGMEDMGDVDDAMDQDQQDITETDGQVDEPGEEDPGTPDIPEDGPIDLDAQKEEAEGENDDDAADKTNEAGEDAEEEAAEDEDVLQDNRPDDSAAAEQVAPSEAQGTGIDEQQQDTTEQADGGAAQQESGTEGAQPEQQQLAGAEGERGAAQPDQAAQGEQQDDQNQESQPFKKLGDALEKWYRQQQQIQDARAEDQQAQEKPDVDMDMADAEFEHLGDEGAEADAQALGAATEDQAKAIDEERGVDVNERETRDDFVPEEQEDQNEPYQPDNDVEMRDGEEDDAQNVTEGEEVDNVPNAFVGESTTAAEQTHDLPIRDAPDANEDVETASQPERPSTEDELADLPALSVDTARQVWNTHESSTRTLSLLLAEHLRLILAPTQATKMRGDFRTGKRLNIKRIIPYIASSYKRDKIWMRRSVPSKRSYQILLAIDDSKSMAEGGASSLAFETLALVSRALSILEAGEIAVVGFGDGVRVAHEFGTPFTGDSGAEVVRRFGFEQSKTNVRKLIEESLTMFREARLKASQDARELWQLQLIISDGVCEDHAGIRQLVRQAQEERIMIVFVIVDGANGGGAGSAAASGAASAAQSGAATPVQKKNSSILDLKSASFKKDPVTGELKVETTRYLDSFPFGYYLVVRDVLELPGVLAGALRQWFAEVVETAQ